MLEKQVTQGRFEKAAVYKGQSVQRSLAQMKTVSQIPGGKTDSWEAHLQKGNFRSTVPTAHQNKL